MPKFLNLVSQSGKQEFVDIKDFNKNPNAYGKYKIRMVDDSTGKNFDIPATMFGQAQQDGLRPWNMEKTATAKPQPTTSQPSSRNVAPTPSYQDLISGDYWSKQLGAKPKQDILPTQNKVGLDLPNFGKQDEYVNRTADVLYNEQQKFAKSEEEAKRIQAQLAEANKRAEALKKQISDENQRRQDSVYVPTYSGFNAQLPQNTNQTLVKKLEQEQDNIAKLSAQLNENEYFKRNLSRLEGVASDLENQASKEILAQEENKSWLSALTTGRDVMRGTYGIQHNEKMNQASAIRENVRETRRMLREASLNNDSFYNKLGRGLRDAFLNINTWDMGVNAVRNSATTLLAKNNIDKGNETVPNNAVLESAAIKNAASQKTKNAISAWYNAGITTTNMIPFMAYIYSSPFNNIGKGLSSSISKMLTQNVEGALLQRMLPQVVYRASVNGLKGIGRFAGDVIGGSATALTFANQNILSDALNRYQGQHTGQFTPDGRFVYTGSQNEKGISRSLLEAFATQAIEYQSELVGEYFTPLNRLLFKGLGKTVGYGTKEMFDAAGNKITSRFFGLPGHKISLDKTVDLFSRLTNAECLSAWNKFAKATKFNGVIGEYLEEVVGNMENATLGINDANWGTGEGGVFNPKENMETFLAVAVGSGFMAGLAAPMSIAHKASINRAYNRANADGIVEFNLNSWQAIREQIDNAPVPELPTIVLNLMEGMNDKQKKVIQNYAAFSVAKQGSLMADFKEQLEKPHIARVGTSVEISADGTERYFVKSMDEQNGLLSTKEFRSEEDANAYKARVEEYINNGRNVQVLNQLLSTDEGLQSAEQIAADMGEPISYISELFYLDPLKRTDTEQAIVDEFVSRANNVAFPTTDVNENHEVQNGQDIAEGTEIGDQQAIDTINQREANAISAWNEIDDPDLKNFVATLTENGSTPNQIVEWLRYYEYPEDVIAAFCELCNAKAEKEGYINRTGQKIEEQVAQQVKQNTFAGTFNGEGTPIILQVQDENGTPLYVVGGNISADEQGVLSSDGLVVLRDEQGNFIQRPNMQGLTLAGTYSVEDYTNFLLTQTQEAVTAQIQSTESQEQPTEEQPVEEQKPETQQQQEQKPTIPVDKDGKKLYTQAPVEDTIADITSELGGDMENVQSVVRTSAENANARLKAAQEKKKKGIKGKDPQEMIANANKLNQEIADAQAEADYWNNALNQIAPQQQATEEPVSQEPSVTQEQPTEEQPQPIDETTIPIEQRAANMYGKLEDEEVRENLDTKISELTKQLSKLPKKPKMVADENVYLQEKEKLNAQRQELQKKLDYWTAVKDYIQKKTKTTPEDIKAAQDELSGTNARLEYAAQQEQGATTPLEIAGEFVKNAKIIPSDFYAETGMQAADARKQFPGMLSNNGVTIASLSEQLVQHDNDNYGGRFFKGDDMEARNAIIQTLTGAESRKALGRNMTAEEEEYVRQAEEQREDFHQEAYGMSYSDYLAFEEQQMPYIWRLISNFAPEQYDQMVAEYYESLPEDYFTHQNIKENGTEQQNPTVAGSNEILPQPPVDNKEGNTGSQDHAAAEGNGDKGDNQDDEVSGDTQQLNIKDSLLPNSSDMHLAENPNGLPDLLPTQGSNESISEGKDTTKSPNSQENQQKTDEKSDEGQKDDVNAEIKKDIEAFIAESTHDVQITNYDEEDYEAQISVDGKPSNIVVTPPMEMEEGMSAEYRPENSSYQELGDLLDEYNETVDRKDQGLDGEHLAAIFSSVDAAINFENWLNEKNNPNAWENLTDEEKIAAIDADEIADENAKELAKEFLRGENTGTIAELFYREIVGRIIDKEESGKKDEKKKEDEKSAKENDEFNDYIKNIQVVNTPFPNDITADNALSSKHNKSGKRDDTYSAVLGIKGNDLYVKTKNANTTSEFVIKNALPYGANDIALRLDYVDITTNEARIAKDLVLELYNKKGFEIQSRFGFNPTLKPLFEKKPTSRKSNNLPPTAQSAIEDGKLIIGGVPESKPKTQAPKTDTPKREKKSDTKQAFDEFKDVMKKFRNAGRADANVSLIGLNARQIEMLADVFRATAKLGYAMVKDGATVFNDWLEKMRAMVSDTIKANSQWNDQDITDLLTETWNNKYLVDGVRKPLSEWAAEEAVNSEQEQEKKEEEKKEEQPATPDNSVVGQSQFPFTKEELEAMTKEQMISAMWQKVFPVVCEKYKVPSDTMDENAYWFAPKMTTGYPKDSLVAACMKYMEHLNDEVAAASEKQMNYIMSLAAEDEKRLFRDITLTKTAASRVIDLLKQEENLMYSRSGSAEDFDEIANELEKIARLNGADLSQKDQKKAEKQFVNNTIDALQNALKTGEKPFKSIIDIRKAAREAGMEIEGGKDDIKLQELVEDALVKVARDIMTEARVPGQRDIHKFRKETFEKIKLLYNLQPTISMRSSNRVALQQYSTPLPMAFCADMFANGRIMRMFYSAFEPTAGNGMLVFGIPSNRVHVNEIDENRLENLRGQGFKKVTSQDATMPFEGDGYYDAIITNPPFGEAAAKDYDGYQISGLAPQIALNALSKMRDFGRAVIIIGGEQKFASNGVVQNDKPFLAYLYDHYNVKGVIDMDGSLYAKQGTTYPTRMILIDGRRTAEERAKSNVYPPVQKNWIPKADSFDKLYDTVNELLNSKQKTNGTEIVRSEKQPLQSDRGISDTGDSNDGTDSRKPVPNVATGGKGHGPNGSTGKGSKRRSASESGYGSLFDGSGDLSDGEQTGDGRTTGGDNGRGAEGVDNRQPVDNAVSGVHGTAARGVGLTQKQEKRKLESEKLSYRPHNTAFSLESVAPAAMVEAMDKTLKRIEDEYGNIDEFVTNELGYDSVDAMHKALAAEQVDSVAMAIYNMKKGEALVIGDQTGVGKGRQMAALIRWAVKQGKKPVFMTQKSNLFNDIYRDLKDIGSENLKPFIFNNDKDAKISEITEDENGNEKEKLIYRSATESDITKALQDGKIPDDCDFVLCTYSQVSTGDSISREYEDSLNSQETDGDNKKRSRSRRKPKPGAKPRKDTKATLLRKLAKDNYLMLDESHTAAGESNQGYYMQTLVRDSKAVTFASATYAKRPDTMPLYAMRTSMSKANIGMRELIDAIQKGGVTLQEIMSRALTDSGQMVRRERDMTGVVTDWTTIDDPETVKKAKENYDRTIQAFNAIIDFQNTYLEAYLENQRENLAVVAGNAGYVRGTEKMGVNNTPFANKTYNYTKQLMLALKVDAIVDEVEKQIKEGKKPVIALDNTMGSMLTDLAVGEELEDSTFAASLLRGLDSVMQYTQKDGMGGSYKIRIHPNELGAEGEAAYYQLVSFIKESTKDVFISPLDEIIGKLRKKGYKVGELTGRDKVVVEENGKYYVAKKGKTSKQLLQSRFNNNKIDVLILNKTGSTGISLHASKTFADQRQRVMILAQPLPDINDYMQMIGRIDRTGQVQRGYYINLGLPVPAEQRFLMMLSTKLKSLNANTTTSQESKDNNVEAPDMLNKYGSQVIVEYFKDHPDVYNKLGTDPLNVANEEGGLSEYKTKPDDTDARKLTGHVALLPTDEQQAFYDDVVERYNALIKYLDDTGTNDLKITSLPLNVKTLAKAVSSKGADPEGNNPFAKNAYCEMVEMDVIRKPMKADEIRKAMESVAKGKDPKQAVHDIKSQYESEHQERIDKQKRKYDSDIERNKETLAKFEEKINSNEKMSEEDKKKAVEDKRLTLQQETDRKNEQATKALNFDHERMMKNLDRYTVGESYLMPDNPDVMMFKLVSPAIFLGYKAKDKGITPSSTIAIFATLDGRRRVEIKLSEQNKLNNISEVTSQNYDAAQEVTLDNWDKNAPNQTRKTGYIMTGNILQAIKDTQDENGAFPGQLISYTDSEGNIHDGILMPDKWRPSMMVNAGKPISEMLDTILNGNSVISINGEVEINVERSRSMGNAYILRVPKSKKTGQKYWENKELSQAINGKEYYQSAGMFQAYIPNGKLKDVLDALDKMGVKVSSDITSDLLTEAIKEGNYDPGTNSFGTKYSEDNTINDTAERFDIMKGYNAEQLKVLPRDSYTNRNGNYIVGLDEYIERLKNEKEALSNKIGSNLDSNGNPRSDINSNIMDSRRRESVQAEISRIDNLLSEAEAENNKRLNNAYKFRERYGIDSSGRISIENLSKMFRDFTENKSDIELFEKVADKIKPLNTEIKFNYGLGNKRGYAEIYENRVVYNTDAFIRDIPDEVKATVITHELLHQLLQSSIQTYNLNLSHILNTEQRNAISELKSIYRAVKKAMPEDENGIPFYGTVSIHEMISELANPKFREALSGIQYDDRSILQKIIDCIKSMLGLPVNENNNNALEGAQAALQSLIENYNQNLDLGWRRFWNPWLRLVNKIDYALSSEIDDKALLDKLNSEPTVKVYRAMQVIDGKLYPPMAAKVGGSLVEPTKIGTWYQADEHPELIIQDGTYKDGTPKYKFKLDKGGNDATGKKATDVAAAYNPYWHTSRSPINDQFKSAWIRPNLVTVEVEVPESELTSGYKAQYAKDAVGEVDWKSGSVSGKLAKLGNPRKVILSRYNRVVRVVPVDEIADRFKEMLDGTGIEVPENTVTPQLRTALEAKGVKIGAPEKGVNKNAQIEEALAKGLETDNTLYRKTSDGRQNTSRVSQKQQERMRAKAESLAKSLNVPVKIITVDEAPNDAKGSKGYYNTRTGEVVIVLDNNSSVLDIEQTIAHEVIGHKGLRGLLGRANYYKLMNAIYDNLSEEDKKAIDEAARQNGWQLYTAIDEHLADQAEKMAWDARSASLWQNIIHYLTEALRNIGFIFKPNYKDARYWLWLSKNNLKRSDVMSNIRRNALLSKLDKLSRPEPTVKKDDVLGEPQYLYRDGNYVDSAAYDAIEEKLRKKTFYWKEAFIDYMQAYQVFQNELEKGLKNGLMDNQNALIGENALTSAIEQQQSDFLRLQLRPLQDLIKSLQDEFGSGQEGIRNIENYLMMKHGLERNRVLFMRDWYQAESERKIKSSGELSPEAEYIYERMERAIWQDFDDGNIDEKERDKQLLIALNDAHQQYLSDTMSQFNRIKNDELENYELGIQSLAEAYQRIDDFINQHATFDPNKHDMSGLTALKEYFSGNKYEDDKIIAEVESLDQKIGYEKASELMDAVQNVSQFALDQDYKNGLVTKEGYNRAKNMFRYYVPLRGFDDTTMEDVYGYMTYSKGTGSKSLVHANGRFSKAGSPLATASNMALNAIARGLRNQNKQRAYRLVNTWLKDNPDAKAPAIVADLWVGLDNNGNDIVHTPNITDDMSAEEIRDEIERFNEEMKFLESQGKATKLKSEASFRHRFSSDNHKYEHIVPLMINGKAKMIVFNGNPRPAQALRGDLQPTVNKEFGMDRIMGQFNRIMAGAFTSYNPTFMMTNLLRDTGFANNTIAVKEGLEYYSKFTKNQAKLLTKDIGSYAKLKWNYDKGIAPRNKMEQYFYEFMRNGGKTGFVNQQDIAKLEKMLGAYNKQLSIPGQTIKVINALPQAIKAANERIENINRLAAYVTSRETGRSVMRSIYDAKEVSVNFNRKGAGGNTANTPNATFNMKLAANLASFAKNSYLFFNAGIQSLNLLSKNYRDHKVKLAAYAVGIPILLGGLVLPLLNQILAESFGDGDDDPYANLPEWTRRNNFCFYLGGGRFLKIPLPIELRAFYGLGDIAAGYLVNNNLKSEKNVALDMASQLSQILPVDFLGEGGSVTAAFTPDAIKPLMQIATNTDWTGKPIYKDSEWNKYEPEYTKAFKGEFEPFVNLSKWINEVSGGSDHVKGSLDSSWNNPAIWHAVIQGYGGGAVMDAVRLGNIGKRVATGDFKNFSTKEIPIIKAIFDTPSEKTQFYRMLNKFYNYREEANRFDHDLKAYRESASPLDHAKYLNYVNPNKPSAEFRRLRIMKEYESIEGKINKVLKNPRLSEVEREAWEEQLTKLKVDAVKKLDQIE